LKFIKIFHIILIMHGFGLSAAFAQPEIGSVSIPDIRHGQTVSISGNFFGEKNPAAPLMWDDCEGKQTDSDSAIAAVWDEVMPWLHRAPVTSHRTRYRRAPFRNTPPPHSRSQQYISGGHYDDAPNYNNGAYKNVGVTVDSGAANKNKWIGMWYYRLDPLWKNPCGSYNNHKTDAINTGPGGYDIPQNYTVYRGGSYDPCSSYDNNTQFRLMTCDGADAFYSAPNPRLQWIRYQRRNQSDASAGIKEISVNNKRVAFTTSESGCANWLNNTRSFLVGGYYRWAYNLADISTYHGGNDNFRYFDDIYIDTTFSRVMLANDSDYCCIFSLKLMQ